MDVCELEEKKNHPVQVLAGRLILPESMLCFVFSCAGDRVWILSVLSEHRTVFTFAGQDSNPKLSASLT